MAHSSFYGINMKINLRCCRCLQELDATVLRPRSHEHGDVIVDVEPCEKCMKEIVVTPSNSPGDDPDHLEENHAEYQHHVPMRRV